MNLPTCSVSAIKRARLIVAALANPKLRTQMLDQLGSPWTGEIQGPQFDWIQDGEVDVSLLRETAKELAGMFNADLILSVERIDTLPVKSDEVSQLSEKILRTVYERIAPKKTLTETELNCALSMLVADVATVRRACVDAGILERSSDGRVYRLT